MNNLRYFEELYNPYRITKKGNTFILTSSLGSFVIKNKFDNYHELYSYLENRSFNNFPKIVNENEKLISYEYLNEDHIFLEQKVSGMGRLLGLLHTKTVYLKSVKKDCYINIINDIKNNIEFLKTEFEGLFLSYIQKEYNSPEEYFFLRNYFKINNAINLSNEYIDNFENLIKDKIDMRVAIIHNNLSINHYIENKDNSYFISFDNYKVDNPVLDLINLYKKEYNLYNFKIFLLEYESVFSLLEDEKELLKSILFLPFYEESNYDYFKRLIIYIDKTNELFNINNFVNEIE